MKQQRTYKILAIIIVLLAIGGVAAAYYISRANVSTNDSMQGMDHSTMTMSDKTNESETYKKYAALKGEEYDKDFVANMIVHHESAMNMAEMTLASAKHQELKDLATSINASQGKEVMDMRSWQTAWGYPATSGHSMTGMMEAGHSMEGMEDMNAALVGLTGDAFDKKFLELMIEHHQGAIDMAKPASSNAAHQEVKD
ncbi:DUF305 domain-containing protein [Candidatus Saccharibacteria bacterium]|nr:DUF305 domain-containing protein [Candidatus Saccharibacteria bacterium]